MEGQGPRTETWIELLGPELWVTESCLRVWERKGRWSRNSRNLDLEVVNKKH